MVGMERKNENSRAAARDMPASCPAAMVAIEREVPGKTAERIWQAPIHTAWPNDMSSIFQVRMGFLGAFGPDISHTAFMPSTIHITIPPTRREAPMTYKLSRFLPISLVSRKEGM